MKTRMLPLLTLASLTISGCAAFSDDATAPVSADGSLSVAAAFYPLQYVAERVGGEHVAVTNLTQPGAEPHDLSLSVQQTAAVAQSDVVVYEAGFQPSVDAAVEQKTSGEIVDAATAVTLNPITGGDHAHEEHADEEHAEDDGHDHGDLDPHFWHDPAKVAELADATATALSAADPDHSTDYQANATALKADLTALDGEFASRLANCQRKVVVVSHDAFGYLTKYGLAFESIAGLSPDSEPTPADLKHLQELIQSDGVTTVFSERLAPKDMAESLATDTGVTSAVLDPIEGLSSENPNADYLSIMSENLAALQKANGC